MSYILNGTTIKRPSSMEEGNSSQYAAVRTLAGTNHRDYLGANKRTWTLQYLNLNPTDYNTINTLYQAYLSNKAAQSWQITESQYTVSPTNVHVELTVRQFKVPGSTYLADCVLLLTEV